MTVGGWREHFSRTLPVCLLPVRLLYAVGERNLPALAANIVYHTRDEIRIGAARGIT
jgi:hypothetical protein